MGLVDYFLIFGASRGQYDRTHIYIFLARQRSMKSSILVHSCFGSNPIFGYFHRVHILVNLERSCELHTFGNPHF